MDGYTFALHEKELNSGMMKTVHVGNKAIALAKVDDEVFAIDDTCSHQECSLGSEGALDGNVVICGCHGGQFDVTSGKVLALPAVSDVASYPVKIVNGDVMIKV
ncbi:MAG: non-heme iron oxygenase ferredoxin subunit [Patescibacteria group bacterium]